MSELTHTFIIGDEKREPERIAYLKKYFDGIENIRYFQPTYKNTLSQEEIAKYVPVNWTQWDRPLRLSEISLFLNFIYLFEKILAEYNDGYFLILESDVLFLTEYQGYKKYIDDILIKIKELDIDCSSIGRGCNLDPPGINHNFQGYQFVKMIKTRCTDSLIFSYKGIQKIYSHIINFLKEGKSLNQPVDIFFETYFDLNKDYKFIWIYPSICVQGSQNDTYETSIQVIKVDWENFQS